MSFRFPSFVLVVTQFASLNQLRYTLLFDYTITSFLWIILLMSFAGVSSETIGTVYAHIISSAIRCYPMYVYFDRDPWFGLCHSMAVSSWVRSHHSISSLLSFVGAADVFCARYAFGLPLLFQLLYDRGLFGGILKW